MKRNTLINRRSLTVVMCLTIIVCLSTAATAFFWNKDDSLPTIASFSKNSGYGAVVTFSEEDFTSRLSSGATLDGIVISKLPDPSLGVLKIGGRSLLRGEGVPAEGLSALRFVPATEGEASATFDFIPVFKNKDENAGYESIQVTVNLTENAGSPPVCENLRFETYMNIPICGKFKCTDPDGGKAASYKIIDSPKLGAIKVEKDGFRYTPHTDKHGEDTFTYVATDDKGNTSDPATATVRIHKRKAKNAVSYADMESHPAHFAAIRLSEMGVLTGSSIGSNYFLNPDMPVTRSEFVAMAVTAADIATPAAALHTGLADDTVIPAWAKPYVSAALNAGLVRGSMRADGSRVFRSEDPLTRAEAAVILNQIASITDEGREASFTDSGTIPAWALQAALNVHSANIMETVDGAMMPSATVSRGDAAQLLYDAVCLMEEKEEGGLLAWASIK